MAALQYAAGTTTSLRRSYRRFTSETLNSRKHVLLVSSSFTLFPAKPTKRKNHLRQKILKTLEKPITPKLPPSNPITPIDSPPFQEIQEILESEKFEISEAGSEEVGKFEEIGVSIDRNVLRNSILNYGLWLVGAFVFQTVCAIWVFSSAGTDNKNQILNGTEKGSVLEVTESGESKSRVKFVVKENSALDSIAYVDELETDRKIEEIRVMAREAREMERLESENSGYDVEIDDRLIKLRKNLEKAHGKMLKQSETNGLEKKGELDEGESNGGLLYKKKHKFKGGPANLTEKPKGFGGLKNGIAVEKNDGKKLNGEAVKSRKYSALDISVASNELAKVNDSLEGERVGDVTSVRKGETGADFWWLSLPYVLVIVMRRGEDGEGGEGLYSVKSVSSTGDRISHMVAFEDRGDATNFRYILQSFFEDLEDFKADIVPLTVKELNEAAEYYRWRVIVVKRGQLKLYAGQPLVDAETALRATLI
ncbi:hypothetical protein PHJA_000489600 [Phtheirospermum japonicum]|uniref:Uncharacterized protein n=1 Tax=Phtheirospermum japonicum TaxID=374723 RepID=A0A830BBP0_9LAMI|nr:hypothetical protein PHJA_000489600 [Phtheirospermum japonicum]